MGLDDKSCGPCQGGQPPMDQDKAEQMVRQVPGWDLRGETIQRIFSFKNFARSMEFVNRVAEIAEAEGHHPDIGISWNRVTLTLTTHAIGGLSENDFIIAAKVNSLLDQASMPTMVIKKDDKDKGGS